MGTVRVDASQCRDELFWILHRVVTDDERYIVATEGGNAVIVSEETWDGLMETLFILSDPEMLSSMEEAESEYPDGCVEWRECLRCMGEQPSGNEPSSDREHNSSEVGCLATEPFIEGMVIDTPEAAANLEALIESGVKWKRGNTEFTYGEVDDEFVREVTEKYGEKD